MGEKLNSSELELFRKLTGREQPPTKRVDELVCVVGRRGGKSSAIAALAVYIAALCKHTGGDGAGDLRRARPEAGARLFGLLCRHYGEHAAA
jgi:hypothetical protein